MDINNNITDPDRNMDDDDSDEYDNDFEGFVPMPDDMSIESAQHGGGEGITTDIATNFGSNPLAPLPRNLYPRGGCPSVMLTKNGSYQRKYPPYSLVPETEFDDSVMGGLIGDSIFDTDEELSDEDNVRACKHCKKARAKTASAGPVEPVDAPATDIQDDAKEAGVSDVSEPLKPSK